MRLFVLLMLAPLSMALAAEPQRAVVIAPLTDVWTTPPTVGIRPSDDLRETQLLYGEIVQIYESSGPWVHIEAFEQPEFTHHYRWEGYPGWVLGSDLKKPQVEEPLRCVSVRPWALIHSELPAPLLPMGSFYLGPCDEKRGLQLFPQKLDNPQGKRNPILKTTEQIIGTPYLWGGLTVQYLNQISDTLSNPNKFFHLGIDCSGLVHLSYRVNGLVVPRDSHEQWMKAKPIKRTELKPADLIFSAKAENPKKITHVALYAGDGQIIEAPQTGMVVRKISFKEKYGKPLNEVESGDRVDERVVYFGSFLQK